MKHLRPLFIILAVLVAVFTLASCDPETSAFTVQVPQFAEGNGAKDVGIEITQDTINDISTVKRFFAYRVAPPITGFKEQKIAKGDKINTSLLGNPITLTMTVSSNGNYVFTGSTDSEYINVEISKDNKTFSYVHSLILDVNGVQNGEDEFDVVIGEGEILSANHFDSHGTAYYLGLSGDAARYDFLLHGKEGGKMAWLCYEGEKKENQDSVVFTNASNYDTECVGIVNSRVSGESASMYVASFDKEGLDFDSVVSNPDASESEKFEEIFNTNGLGQALESMDSCIDKINGWPGFNSWDINGSFTKWTSK